MAKHYHNIDVTLDVDNDLGPEIVTDTKWPISNLPVRINNEWLHLSVYLKFI